MRRPSPRGTKWSESGRISPGSGVIPSFNKYLLSISCSNPRSRTLENINKTFQEVGATDCKLYGCRDVSVYIFSFRDALPYYFRVASSFTYCICRLHQESKYSRDWGERGKFGEIAYGYQMWQKLHFPPWALATIVLETLGPSQFQTFCSLWLAVSWWFEYTYVYSHAPPGAILVLGLGSTTAPPGVLEEWIGNQLFIEFFHETNQPSPCWAL